MSGREAIAAAFDRFAAPGGYARACRFLAVDGDRWLEIRDYTAALGAAIATARERSLGVPLVGVDLACGEYAWLARHFRGEFRRLYLLDQSEDARRGAEPLLDDRTTFVLGDGAATLPTLAEVDFVYGGFSFYRPFVAGMRAALGPTGSFFVMVPVDGDDLRWREQVSGRSIAARAREIEEIEIDLRRDFEVTTERRTFHWTFTEVEVAELVAASAVVCFGWDLLTPPRREQLEAIGRSLEDRAVGGQLALTQQAVIWRGQRVPT